MRGFQVSERHTFISVLYLRIINLTSKNSDLFLLFPLTDQ